MKQTKDVKWYLKPVVLLCQSKFQKLSARLVWLPCGRCRPLSRTLTSQLYLWPIYQIPAFLRVITAKHLRLLKGTQRHLISEFWEYCRSRPVKTIRRVIRPTCLSLLLRPFLSLSLSLPPLSLSLSHSLSLSLPPLSLSLPPLSRNNIHSTYHALETVLGSVSSTYITCLCSMYYVCLILTSWVPESERLLYWHVYREFARLLLACAGFPAISQIYRLIRLNPKALKKGISPTFVRIDLNLAPSVVLGIENWRLFTWAKLTPTAPSLTEHLHDVRRASFLNCFAHWLSLERGLPVFKLLRGCCKHIYISNSQYSYE